MAGSEAGLRIVAAAEALGATFGRQVDLHMTAYTNWVIEAVAQQVEAMELYDGYDENTRNAAVQRIRLLKVERASSNATEGESDDQS